MGWGPGRQPGQAHNAAFKLAYGDSGPVPSMIDSGVLESFIKVIPLRKTRSSISPTMSACSTSSAPSAFATRQMLHMMCNMMGARDYALTSCNVCTIQPCSDNVALVFHVGQVPMSEH